MSYAFHTADVFTDCLHGGNPLAVIPDARGLSHRQMLAITREFNYSESVFVFPPETKTHTRRVRIYTPAGELPFAGKSPRELFQQLLTQHPIPLNSAHKGLRFPAAVEATVMQGLERDLSKRCKTVDEFAKAFCTAVREETPKRTGFLAGLFRKSGD